MTAPWADHQDYRAAAFSEHARQMQAFRRTHHQTRLEQDRTRATMLDNLPALAPLPTTRLAWYWRN